MSDQTISGSPGSKQQSAGEAQGRCEETEFLHWQFLHLYISPLEEGDEEILLRGGREESSRSSSNNKTPPGSCGAAAQGNKLGNLGMGIFVVMGAVPQAPSCLQTLGCPPVLGYSVRCNMYMDAHFFFEHFRSSCIFLCPQLSWSRGPVGEDDDLFGDGGMNNYFLQPDGLLPISVSNYQVIAANERLCFIHLTL